MTDHNGQELAHTSEAVENIVTGLIPPGTGAEVASKVRRALSPAVAAGYAAGQASREPVEPRLAMLAATLRAQHQREQFGDCTEDGDPFPCRTIRAIDIIVGPPEEQPLLTVDDILGS